MHLQRIITCLILGVLLLHGAPGTGNFILCIGEDGHIAVEQKADNKTEGCCGNASHDHDHGCGDCIDLPVSLDDLIMPSVVVSPDGTDFTLLAHGVPVSGLSTRVDQALIPQAIPPPSSTSLLRTVILLI
jgi:hypothetical protein